MSDEVDGPRTGGERTVWWTILASAAVVLVALGAVVLTDGGGDERLTTDGPAKSTSATSTSEPPPDPEPDQVPDPATSTTTDSPDEPEPETTTSTSAPDSIGECPADRLSDRQRLGQLVMIGVDPASTSHARQMVQDHHIGGIFIGGDDPTLIASGTLADLTGPAGIDPFVAVDDEGGRVQRIEMLVGDIPSAREMTRTATPEEITRLAQRRGEQLSSYGINVDFAPVLDVTDQSDREVIGDRSFGSDPDTVIRNAEAFASGLRGAGVMAVYKHFPGHGHAEGDSHLGASRAPALERLGPDLAPFEALMGRHGNTAVMVGHLTVPGLTGGEPATISPAAINGLLRGDMGYDGLVFTDELGGMKAISDRYGPSEAARRTLTAGADVALFAHPTDAPRLLDELEASLRSGALPREVVDGALARVLRAKGHDCP